MRVHVCAVRMTLQRADVLEAYLNGQDIIQKATVYERTGDVEARTTFLMFSFFIINALLLIKIHFCTLMRTLPSHPLSLIRG